MDRINWNRVILGGLAAGVVIDIVEGVVNGLVLAEDWAAAMQSLNRSGEMTGGQIAALNIWGLVFGIFAVWLYAAIRPRYGAGPKTAVCAGIAAWFAGYLMSGVIPVIFGMYPVRLMSIGFVIGLFEVVVATLVGAWLYKEAGSTSGIASSATSGR